MRRLVPYLAAGLLALGLSILSLDAQAQFGGMLWQPPGGAPPPGSSIGFDTLSGTNNNTSALSYTHTVTGANPFLIAYLYCYRSTTPPSVLTWTYNGVAMTLLDGPVDTTAANGNIVRTFVYYMKAPPTGAHTLGITLTSGCSTQGFLRGVSYSGVDQTAPIDAHAIPFTTPAATSQTATVTVGVANAWLVGAAGMNSPSTQTIVAGAGTTSRYTADTGTTLAEMYADSGGPVSIGSQSLNYSVSTGSQIWFSAPVVSLKPAP